MFNNKKVQAAFTALLAENSDLRQQLRVEREQNQKREQALLDRILALTAPGSLRQVVRATAEPQPLEPSGRTQETANKRRVHFPGDLPSTRPPFPRPQTALENSESTPSEKDA